MKPSRIALYSFLFLLGLAGVIIVANIPPSLILNEPGSSVVTIVGDRTEIEPGIKAMIDTWQKGAPTNGMYCAIQLIRHREPPKLDPVCYVNVVNPTKGRLERCLYLPNEVLMQISLLDPQGKSVEKTAAGQQFTNWTVPQMENWHKDRFQKLPRVRVPYLRLEPFSYLALPGLRPGELFQLQQPGQYTLHVRLQLVENKTVDPKKNPQLKIITFPEVAAKVEILPQDIPPAIPVQNPATNAPP